MHLSHGYINIQPRCTVQYVVIYPPDVQAAAPRVHVGPAPQAHPPQPLPHGREGPPHQGGAQQALLQGTQDLSHLSNMLLKLLVPKLSGILKGT